MKKKGYDPGPLDGILGPKTEKALKDYQRAEGLTASGLLDAATAKRLELQEEQRRVTPEHVREVQKALVETGHDPGPIDGVFGPRTKDALRRYVAVPPPKAPTPAQEIIARFRRANDRGQSP